MAQNTRQERKNKYKNQTKNSGNQKHLYSNEPRINFAKGKEEIKYDKSQ